MEIRRKLHHKPAKCEIRFVRSLVRSRQTQQPVYYLFGHNTSTQLKNDEEIINLKLKLNSKSSGNNNIPTTRKIRQSENERRKKWDKTLFQEWKLLSSLCLCGTKSGFSSHHKKMQHIFCSLRCVFSHVWFLCVLATHNREKKKEYKCGERERECGKSWKKKSDEKENQSEITKRTDKNASAQKKQRCGFQKRRTLSYAHKINFTPFLCVQFPAKFDNDDDIEEKFAICWLQTQKMREREGKKARKKNLYSYLCAVYFE